MDLTDVSKPATVEYLGNDVFVLTSGTRLQIRDNETGEIVERLDEVVPSGKSWEIHLHITITET